MFITAAKLQGFVGKRCHMAPSRDFFLKQIKAVQIRYKIVVYICAFSHVTQKLRKRETNFFCYSVDF